MQSFTVFGFEMTIAEAACLQAPSPCPACRPWACPSTFKTSQHTFMGPRANFQYTRSNVRGKAEIITIGGLAGPLDGGGIVRLHGPELPLDELDCQFVGYRRIQQKRIQSLHHGKPKFGFQLQKPLDANKNTESVSAIYAHANGPDEPPDSPLVSDKDLHTRLSTLAAVYIRDTRDNPLDAHKGVYNSFEVNVNPGCSDEHPISER